MSSVPAATLSPLQASARYGALGPVNLASDTRTPTTQPSVVTVSKVEAL